MIVSLSSSSSNLTVPATVTVAARATTAGFNITASAVTQTETVTLTATLGGLTETEPIQLLAPATSSAPAYNVDLSWAAPATSSTALAGYRVYRASNGSSTFQALNSALETLTAYIDSTVQNGQTYSYRVTSVDSTGAESVPSASINVSIPN
jgi:fibronectin type 3 domain-containing protein